MGTFLSQSANQTHVTMKVVLFSTLLAVAAASPLPDHPPAPYHAPAPYAPEPVAPPVYNYEYGVNDPHYGPVFSHAENRDNYNTGGEYRVNLPDGRVQIVTYKADENGFVADVKYEGEATYPEEPAYKPAPKPAYKPAPAPAYKPAPKPVYHKPAPAPYHPAPAYKPHPAPYHPAPAYKAAPVYHPAPAPYHAPVVHKPAPYHAPVVHKPAPYVAPVVHKPVVHPAPAYHKPAPYHEPAYDGPAVYQYGYAVQDDYSKANFAANENRDGDVVTGEYRVALPGGRTQIVTYTANGYDGYVADVKYEGVAQYPEYKPAPYHAPKPAPYHA